ncbi:MAG TPA: hypothetical protein DCE56_34070 [Cyanobacteria bacterium UBA8553]|nr:hypothetical protein [Cyanobacteria bacterium UBA8553]HAJ61977.1 hypothetical protein [Cyanobacteria bacterium UBA8543]
MPPPPPGGPQRPRQATDSELYTKNILGPVTFELSYLDVAGSSIAPADPTQSQYIVASNEPFTVSVQINFNNSPLTKLLMCLGTTIKVDFGVEGFGAAPETNLTANIVTEPDKLVYIAQWTGTPDDAQLTAGLYEIGATVTVGPANHPCAQFVFGFGYIEEILLQVYPAF